MMVNEEGQLYRDLSEIWAGVLGIRSINPDDNFFSLGGDSLQLVQMVVRLSAKYGHDFDYDQFFDQPSIRTLVGILLSARV